MTVPDGDRDAANRAIRKARPEDMGRLVELCRRYAEADGNQFDAATTESALAGLLDGAGPGFVLVACDGNLPIGYAVVTWGYSIESGGRDALLDEIYLDIRNRGIGTRLLHAAVDRARAGGARRMFLETELDNGRARTFYMRSGFELERSIWLSRYL